MSAIDFPNSPVLNQEFTAGTAIYIWDGVAWRIKSSAIPAISSIVSYADEAPINPVAGQIWVESDVDVITYNPQIVTRWSKVLTESESVFDDYSPTGTFLQYTVGYESVYLNGVLLLRGTDYTATDGLIVTLTTAAQAGDVIEIISPNNYINVNTYTVSEVDSQLSLKANLASPTFTGTVDFSSATVTGIDLLPSQTENAGKFLTTNGTAAAWSNTITVSSGTAIPLSIQNNGTGNSFVINDESLDSSPFVIDSSGNVGVGVSSPSYKVDVSGTVNASEYYLNGSPFRGGATGGGTDAVFYENDQAVTTNYTLTAGKNAITAGPVTINDGVTITIPSNSVWTVV